MAIDAKVSFVNQMKERMADTLTVEQADKMEKTCYSLLDSFDMSEVIQDEGPDDLLDSYVAAMKVECRSQKTIDRYVYIIGKLMEFAKVLGHEKLDTTMKYVVLNKDDIKASYRRAT